jgi:glyoxylase-like metal-dependent hydrolase (beta-lactamase superfamily II)
VKAVLVTHAHWDHVGGQRAYRKMAEPPTLWASAKWEEQLHHQEGTGGPYELWWGTRFDLTAVTSFRPDETVAERKTVTIDGTEIEMIPVAGGETRDGLLFHFKGLQTVFGGDFVMPYIGAPFMEEGNPVGLADAIATLKALAPKRILHGHEGINRLFPTGEVLFGMEAPIRWLVRETEARLAQGQTKEAILHANLTPEQHFAGRPELELPYIVIREHLIKRVADLKLGYWQVGITGADDLTPKELGSVLVHYAGLDLDDQASLIESMVEAGDHALALRTVDTLLAHAPDDARLRAARRTALLGLIEQEQVLDAFKFIWYSGEAGFELGEPK